MNLNDWWPVHWGGTWLQQLMEQRLHFPAVSRRAVCDSDIGALTFVATCGCH